ncbi:unnamed protein product [Heterobilharzia americana]|nr:unnamed protein product [Heterobilharzia americana]
MSDSGMLDFKPIAEMHDYLEDLGLRFEYGCVRENDPVSEYVAFSLQRYIITTKVVIRGLYDILKENCFKNNYADSCFKLGSLKIIGGTDVLRDPLEAFRAFEHGCKAGKQGKCCQAAGRLVADGIASHTPSLSTAMPFFELGCQFKASESCFHLGGAAMVLARENDKSSDSKKSDSHRLRCEAFKAWMEGCRLGHEFSCRNIAKMYSSGDGVESDELKAKDYMMKLIN